MIEIVSIYFINNKENINISAMYFYFGLIKLRLWDPYFFMMTGFFFFQTLDLKSKNSMKNMRRTSQWC